MEHWGWRDHEGQEQPGYFLVWSQPGASGAVLRVQKGRPITPERAGAGLYRPAERSVEIVELETPEATESGLRELAERLLAISFGSGRPYGPPRLFPRALPADLPVTPPLPDGTQILGAMVAGGFSQIVGDVDLPPLEVVRFYRRHFLAGEWTLMSQERAPTGFVGPERWEHRSALFCRGPEGPAVSPAARWVPGKPTELQVNVHAADPEHTPCRQPYGFPQRRVPTRTQARLPPLHAPQGAIFDGGGGHGGPGTWASQARLWTDAPVDELLRHYNAQLADAGWRRENDGTDGTAGWSAWSFTDDDAGEALGSFLVLQYPEPGSYLLLVRTILPDGMG